MKYIMFATLIGLVFFVTMPSCVKNTATVVYRTDSSTQHLNLLTPVKKGEPFVISAIAPDSNGTTLWTIRPSDSTHLSFSGNVATISITHPGNYIITANFYSSTSNITPYDSSIYAITVKDSLYIPISGSGYDTVLLGGEDLTLVPVSTSNTLEIVVETNINYNCTSFISAIGFFQGSPQPPNTIFFSFDSARVEISKEDCGGAKNPATFSVVLMPLAIGLNPINVQLNGILYQGNINVTDSNYTFTWPYSSGVTIAPMQIKK